VALRSLRPGGTLSGLGAYSGKLVMPYDAFAAGLGDHRIITTLCPGGKERMRRLMETVRGGRNGIRAPFPFVRFSRTSTRPCRFHHKPSSVIAASCCTLPDAFDAATASAPDVHTSCVRRPASPHVSEESG